MNQDFHEELSKLINRYGKEKGSDTPDFILANYMASCLDAYDAALEERERWYGRAIGGQSARVIQRTFPDMD
jgi:hypothetical protein